MVGLRKTAIDFIISILIVSFMLWVAESLKLPEIIFPEISALAMGSLVFKKKKWLLNYWEIWFAPTIGASIGVGINLLNIQQMWKEILCLFIIVACMTWFQVKVAPTISAGLLPVVLGITSWFFVISVGILTFLIFVGIKMNKWSPFVHKGNYIEKTYHTSYLVFLILWIFVCNLFNLNELLIPPIFVVVFETLHREYVSVSYGLKQVVLLTGSAIIGSFFFSLFPQSFVLIGVLDLIVVFILTQIVKLQLSPAFAISLLPFVLPNFIIWRYSLFVFLTSFILINTMIFYRIKEKKFQNKRTRYFVHE